MAWNGCNGWIKRVQGPSKWNVLQVDISETVPSLSRMSVHLGLGWVVAGRGAVFMRWSFGQLSLIWDLQVTLCPHTRPLTLWGLWSETEGLLLMNRQPATGHAQSIMALLHYVSKYTSARSSVNSALTNREGQGLPAALRQMKMFHIKLCFSQIISLEFHCKSARMVFLFGNDVGGDFWWPLVRVFGMKWWMNREHPDVDCRAYLPEAVSLKP